MKPTIVKKTVSEPVLKQAVENCIRSFLEEEAALESSIGVTRSPLRPVVDSLVIAEVLVQAESIVGCTLPESIIRQGGYHSVAEALDHLIPQIVQCWKNEQEK